MADTNLGTAGSLLDPQANRIMHLRFPNNDGPPSQLLVDQLDATEGLSQDFRFVVRLLSHDARIPTKDLIGKMATVELVRDDGSPRYFNGYVFEFRKVRTDGGWAHYEMVLGPWLAFSRLRKDCFLFHDKSVYESTVEIFDDYAVRDYKSQLGGGDPPITQAMQWEESDYNYLHRRWESRGWYYWYEHRLDGHSLVLGDDSARASPIDGEQRVRFHDSGGSEDEDAVAQWSPVRQVAPTQYAVTSFDFKNPKPIAASTNTVNQQGDVPALEVYEHTGAYGFKSAGEGESLAKRRMEEIEAQARRFDAAGNCKRMQPGRWFELRDHYDHDQGAEEDRQFLVVETHHIASNNYLSSGAPAYYANQLTAVRKKIPWRPGRNLNSEEPRIYGVLSALVVGPEGDEIHCDEFGRVRVQFHFDREGRYDEKSSCWVRVASTWAGERFGFMAVPRIGQEVLVQFLGGNPDMPILTGRVFNQDNMPPWDLPANKTQTGILTRSSSGGGYDNANAVRFEDKKGEEQLWIHAEKNQDIEVENDETHWVGRDRKKTIDRDETVQVKQDRTETVDRNETITVHGQRTETVDKNETITIHQNRNERVDQNEKISIGQNRDEDVGDNETLSIGGHKRETIAMTNMQNVGLAKMTNVGLAYNRNVGAAMVSLVGLSRTDRVGKNYTITVGDSLTVRVGKSVLVMKSDGTVTLNGTKFNFSASGPVEINGKDVDIN